MKAMIKTALVCIFTVTTMSLAAQPPQGGRQQRTPEEQAKSMTEQLKKELGLNETQEKAVYDMNLKMANEMKAARGEGQPDREKMREQMEKRREEQKKEMKKILTDEQYAKWEKLQSERVNGRGPRQGQKQGQGQGERSRNKTRS